MVRDPVQWGSLVVIVFGGLSVALMGIAAQVTPPNVGVSDGAPQATKVTPGILHQYVGFYVRGANRVYTIARDGDHLLLHRPETRARRPRTRAGREGRENLCVRAGQ